MIHIDDDKDGRVIYDDMNPRIYRRYWKCGKCGELILDENNLKLVGAKTYHGDCRDC